MSENLFINNVYKSFDVDGEKRTILKNINLNIKEGEFISIVGHSGCGKSTLLKIIAGLLKSDSGEVILDKKEIEDVGPERGMVFQEHRLFPWLKIQENIKLALHDLPLDEVNTIVSNHIKLVGLGGFENVYPHQVSGGMSQRAAIARALVNNPKVLLLDEPFGALDALTKIRLQQEVLKIWREKKTTMILVTHDIEESIYLADRVIVMSSNPGEIKKIINVEISRPRDRGSIDFARIKKEIYSNFFADESILPEYNI